MTATQAPRRVLVLWCPNWPEPSQDQLPAVDPSFEQVVTVVERFCPRVEVLQPGSCAISARGPARYFGGEEALAAKVAEAVRQHGFDCRIGVADGLFAARLAARVGPSGVIVARGGSREFLYSHPVAALGSPELAGLLPRLGIRTLGEFAALSAAEATARFGTQGTAVHRLASGLDSRPLVPRPPATDLSVQREFDPPAELAEPVIFAAKALADRMHAGLAASGLACVRVQVQVICEDGRESTRLWRHDGLLSALAVAERVRWQLARWRTVAQGDHRDRAGDPAPGGPAPGVRAPADPLTDDSSAAGVILLRLVPDQLVRDEGRQLGLWGDDVVSDRVARAAVRVQAMLGLGSVVRPLLAGGRDPAEQVTLVPFGDVGSPPFPAGRPWPGRLPAPAPATVYPVPLAARVTDETGAAVTVTARAVLSGPPARLSAGGSPSLPVTAWAGPWPVTERWWNPMSVRRRARFQLITDDGSAWLATVQGGRWQLDASYD